MIEVVVAVVVAVESFDVEVESFVVVAAKLEVVAVLVFAVEI